MAGVLLGLFPVVLLFAPRAALAMLALAIILLCHRRLTASRRSAARPAQSTATRQAPWKDPWSTEGL